MRRRRRLPLLGRMARFRPIAAAALLAWLAAGALGFGRALATESASGKKDPARAITSQLICPCSCGEILSGCTCETGKAMQAYVDREVKSGKDKDTIEAALVSQYGEVILGAPKAQGFNLLVWVAPFAAALAGFVIASLLIVKWARRRSEAGAPAVPLSGWGRAGGGFGGRASTPEADLAALRARAEEELRRIRDVGDEGDR